VGIGIHIVGINGMRSPKVLRFIFPSGLWRKRPIGLIIRQGFQTSYKAISDQNFAAISSCESEKPYSINLGFFVWRRNARSQERARYVGGLGAALVLYHKSRTVGSLYQNGAQAAVIESEAQATNQHGSGPGDERLQKNSLRRFREKMLRSERSLRIVCGER
jgi:hypothetical protein